MSIQKEDIDKLLKGRKIIDSIQKPDSNILNDLHTQAKLSVMRTVTITNKEDAIIANQEIERLMEIEKQSILQAQKDIIELGFEDLGDFIAFNNKLCLDALKECRPIQGFCDLCKGNLDENGKETGPMCGKTYGYSVCKNDIDQTQEILKNFLYIHTLKIIKNHGINFYYRKGTISRGVCPEAHGFYVDETQCKPLPFSLSWRGYSFFNQDMLTKTDVDYIHSIIDESGNVIINEKQEEQNERV